MKVSSLVLTCGLLLGCGPTHEAGDAGTFDAGSDDGGPVGCSEGPTSDVDLLFVIEGAGYTQESQHALVLPLAGFLNALTTGDLNGDGMPDQRPVEQLNVGVITSDMGALGTELPTCDTLMGDDGVLRTETAPFAPAPPGGALERVHTVSPGDDLALAAERIGAVIQTGNDHGCGAEQPLEATLKALSPAEPTRWTGPNYGSPAFWMGEGHGDGANAGLVRDGSVLAIVVLSSEEDLSAADPSFFALDGVGNLQTRYITHPDGLHPTERYVAGFDEWREDPTRLVLGLVIGLPREVAESIPADEVGIEELLDHPLMEYAIDPTSPRPLSVCGGLAGAPVPYAFPARRLLEVARGAERRGSRAVVSSACEADQTPLYAGLARAIGRALDGRPCE